MTVSPTARWSLLSKAVSSARSSHSLCFTHSGLLLVYGGELHPRTPIDSASPLDGPQTDHFAGSVHVFPYRNLLQKTEKGAEAQDRWITHQPEPTIPTAVTPEPRVGATTVWEAATKSIYLWGGRGGVDMTPLDREQAGIWRGQVDETGISSFIRWERVVATNEDDAPESRSYHAAVSSEGKIYIHAGCPTSGRLTTLHSFDLTRRKWSALASAPGPGRGGTALAVVRLPDEEHPVILRFAGFAGYELGADNTLDIYSIAANTWKTVVPLPDPTAGYPGPRSVHGFVPFSSARPHLRDAVALLYHGEREPSAQGHAGAGKFWDDVWLLEHRSDKLAAQSSESRGLSWRHVEVPRDTEKPEGRGWFPGAGDIDDNGETSVAMFGGLLSSNERSGELWSLVIE